MLELSANPDISTTENIAITNEYYDWDATFTDKEIWGEDAINQSIEMVLTTEPQERLFNIGFGSPLFGLVFENEETVRNNMDGVFDIIEYWVPIKISRSNADIEVNTDEHAISFKIPYVSNNGTIVGYFARKIMR